jgi:hypothetical protein
MLDDILRALDFKQSSVNMCLYFKIIETTLVLVGVCVDALLVTSNNAKLVDEFFTEMKTLNVKDVGIV